MRKTRKPRVPAAIVLSAERPPDVVRMLDEIERLRRVLAIEHNPMCALLRHDVPCDCGHRTIKEEIAAMKRRLERRLEQERKLAA